MMCDDPRLEKLLAIFVYTPGKPLVSLLPAVSDTLVETPWQTPESYSVEDRLSTVH